MSSSSTAAVRARPWRSAPVVFAGHGAVIPDKGIDQLAGTDLKGAVVLILYDTPEGLPAYPERVAAVAAAGAAAVIGIIGKELPWPVVQRVYDAGQKKLGTHAPAPLAGAMSRPAAESVIRASGAELAALLATPAAASKPVPLKLRASFEVATAIDRIQTHNVVGRLRGTGGGGETLLYLSHWDHLGQCEKEAEDKICNGAVDNASGIAALLEIARALGRGPRPKRDIVFLATTAEEMGLLGAEYFASRPTVPLSSIVAAINMDTLAITPKGEPVAVMGRGHERLEFRHRPDDCRNGPKAGPRRRGRRVRPAPGRLGLHSGRSPLDHGGRIVRRYEEAGRLPRGTLSFRRRQSGPGPDARRRGRGHRPDDRARKEAGGSGRLSLAKPLIL